MKLSHLLSLLLIVFSTYTVFGQCEGFNNYPLGEEAGKRNHYDYRQAMKKNNIEAAIPKWRKAIQYTPAGSAWHYADGIKVYEFLLSKEEDETKQSAYKDSIFMMYDQRLQCLAKSNKSKGDILTKKAFSMYKHGSSYDDIYATYQEGIALIGNKAKHYVIYPFAYVGVEQFKNGKITNKEAQDLYKRLSGIAEYNVENQKGESKKFKFQDLKDKLDNLFYQKMEPAIFDCQYYADIYLPMYEAEPDNPELYREVYSALVSGGCSRDMPILQEIHLKDSLLFEQEKEMAFQASRAAAPKSKKAVWAYQDEDYERSALLFIEGAAEEDKLDGASRAEMCFKAAQIAFANLKDYPKARDYAEKALEYYPNWGKPYLLLGDLYASSGPLCGSGRGFKSQTVTWIAIDMWKKAKEVDKDAFVQKKAKSQIAKYTQYMPTAEDLHIRKLKEGQTYKIPCWIQRTTKVRAYNQYRNPR